MTERLSMRAIREILRLRWVQRQPHRAVAVSTGRSVGAVYETLRRAREAGLEWAGVDGMTDDALEAALYLSAVTQFSPAVVTEISPPP